MNARSSALIAPLAGATFGQPQYIANALALVPFVTLLAAYGVDWIRELIAPFEVVEIDARIATAAADIRHRARMKLLDAYILATAQVSGSILITRNTKDFPAEMPGIRVPYTL